MKKDAFELWLAGRTEEALTLANEQHEKICSMGATEYYREEKRKHPVRRKKKNMILPPKN